jgi:hypothetical protein
LEEARVAGEAFKRARKDGRQRDERRLLRAMRDMGIE